MEERNGGDRENPLPGLRARPLPQAGEVTNGYGSRHLQLCQREPDRGFDLLLMDGGDGESALGIDLLGLAGRIVELFADVLSCRAGTKRFAAGRFARPSHRTQSRIPSVLAAVPKTG